MSCSGFSTLADTSASMVGPEMRAEGIISIQRNVAVQERLDADRSLLRLWATRSSRRRRVMNIRSAGPRSKNVSTFSRDLS